MGNAENPFYFKEEPIMPTKKMTNKEKIEVLQKQVWKEVCEFMEKPEDMLEYLNFLQKFPQYSIHNRMLIHSQRPGAVAVASFKKFKEAGVKVRKGEKALRIFAPTSNKYFYRDNGEKRTLVPLKFAKKEEKELIKEGKIKVYTWQGYVPVPVFDVLQTDMKEEDYPKIFPNAHTTFKTTISYDHNHVVNVVTSILKELNVKLITPSSNEVWDGGNAKGYYAETSFGNMIVMNPNNTPSENDATLLHELSHAILHTQFSNVIQDKLKLKKHNSISRSEKELQAEMTAFLICQEVGIDTRESTVRYIASWTNEGKKISENRLTEFFEEVVKTADYVISEISEKKVA